MYMEAITLRRLIGSFVLATMMGVSQGVSASDECFERIESTEPFELIDGLTTDRVVMDFEPVPHSICLPTVGGGCRPFKDDRVSVALTMIVGGKKFTGYANDLLRETLVEERLIPKKGSLDASASPLGLGRLNQNVIAGTFDYRLEKWGKTNGFKCRGFKCRKTTWKTRLWRRTTRVDVSLTQSFPSPQRMKFSPEAKPRKDAKFLEKLLIGGVLETLFGGSGLIGFIASEDIVGDFIESLAGSIDPADQEIDSIEEYFSSKFSGTQAWPRMRELLRSMEYNKEKTGFFGSWEYRATQVTPNDPSKLLDTVDFCTIVRPVLENTFGADNEFLALPSEVIENSGNHDRTITVEPGSNVWSLSRDHYGNRRLYSHVLRANNLDEQTARAISPGRQLKFPSTISILTGARFVVAGENLWGISEGMLGEGAAYPLLDIRNRELQNPNLIYPLDGVVRK